MASAHQEITIFGGNNEPLSESDLLILIKKTGYYNFWINGKHYFYDEREDTSHISNNLFVFAFNGGKSEDEKKKKKGKITIKKK